MATYEIRSFRDLDTWKIGMDLAVATYPLAAKLPSSERFELSQQIRRASTSVPANVAEGHATGKDGMFLRHVCIALGSLGELDTELELARRLGFLSEADLAAALEQINRVGSCSMVCGEHSDARLCEVPRRAWRFLVRRFGCCSRFFANAVVSRF